jgi:hypothetical protein
MAQSVSTQSGNALVPATEKPMQLGRQQSSGSANFAVTALRDVRLEPDVSRQSWRRRIAAIMSRAAILMIDYFSIVAVDICPDLSAPYTDVVDHRDQAANCAGGQPSKDDRARHPHSLVK